MSTHWHLLFLEKFRLVSLFETFENISRCHVGKCIPSMLLHSNAPYWRLFCFGLPIFKTFDMVFSLALMFSTLDSGICVCMCRVVSQKKSLFDEVHSHRIRYLSGFRFGSLHAGNRVHLLFVRIEFIKVIFFRCASSLNGQSKFLSMQMSQLASIIPVSLSWSIINNLDDCLMSSNTFS